MSRGGEEALREGRRCPERGSRRRGGRGKNRGRRGKGRCRLRRRSSSSSSALLGLFRPRLPPLLVVFSCFSRPGSEQSRGLLGVERLSLRCCGSGSGGGRERPRRSGERGELYRSSASTEDRPLPLRRGGGGGRLLLRVRPPRRRRPQDHEVGDEPQRGPKQGEEHRRPQGELCEDVKEHQEGEADGARRAGARGPGPEDDAGVRVAARCGERRGLPEPPLEG